MGYFTNLLVQRAVWKVTNGTDSNNKAKIIEEHEVACKVEFNDSAVVGPMGQELTSSGRLFIEESVKVGDIIGIDEAEYLIVKVNLSYAIDGIEVIKEVYFQ